MGATFSRLKNWIAEVLSNTDLNAEIDNVLNNLTPSGVDDYSTNSTQMRIQTSPGGVGSESLATSLAGELERLRYAIQRMIGGSSSYWYEAPPSTLSDLVAALGTGLPTYRIVSGQTTGNSSQLLALRPSGTTASVTLSASVTPFVYYIGGTQYSITANQTLTGLSLAPSTNNTCSLNRTAAAGQQWTKFLGQYNSTISVDGMNSSVSSLLNQIAGFKSGNEYFIANIESTTALTNAWRGAFFNQTPSNILAVGLTDNDEIKLMKLAWLFANTNSSLAVTYNNPVISATQPTSPTTGDYWFDLSTTAWKTYNSTTWIAANATIIGMTMQDTVACVAARTFDSFKAMSDLNTLTLQRNSNTVVQANAGGGEVSIFGITNRFGVSRPAWDITANLESGVNETLNAMYYMYMKETGAVVISDKAPLQRRDLYGMYHPAETWRCLGNVYNNASTHFESPVRTFRDVANEPFVTMGHLIAMGDVGTIASHFDLFSKPNSPLQEYFIQHCAPHGTNGWTAATNEYWDIATIALTPGIWGLSALLTAIVQGTGTISTISVGISTAAGNNFNDINNGLNNIVGMSDTTAGVDILTLSLPEYWISLTTAKTYYLKAYMSPVPATAVNSGFRINARRLDKLIGVPG